DERSASVGDLRPPTDVAGALPGARPLAPRAPRRRRAPHRPHRVDVRAGARRQGSDRHPGDRRRARRERRMARRAAARAAPPIRPGGSHPRCFLGRSSRLEQALLVGPAGRPRPRPRGRAAEPAVPAAVPGLPPCRPAGGGVVRVLEAGARSHGRGRLGCV
ncbi:MAG: hypothetical protein AVDCRST_MAG20-905, partial [uncultured Acidimicrobiales bacterium]